MLSHLYGTVAARRRRWYAVRPGARRRLRRPVISVGAITVGGSGKTPATVHLARRLEAMGERPAILSRGYRRRDPVDGVVVVRDFHEVQADLARSGDEPLMMAHALTGTSVLVSPDRYLAGRLAEDRLGASVHLLDDGFQHHVLERTADLVVVSTSDLAETQTLPRGRLREPIAALAEADALFVETSTVDEARALAAGAGVGTAFAMTRTLGPGRDAVTGELVAVTPAAKVVAVAGIARPERFFEMLGAHGVDVVDAIPFPDHHAYTTRDVVTITQRCKTSGAVHVVTTEKDLMRLRSHAPFDVPVVWMPLELRVEPSDALDDWLRAQLTVTRGTHA